MTQIYKRFRYERIKAAESFAPRRFIRGFDNSDRQGFNKNLSPHAAYGRKSYRKNKKNTRMQKVSKLKKFGKKRNK